MPSFLSLRLTVTCGLNMWQASYGIHLCDSVVLMCTQFWWIQILDFVRHNLLSLCWDVEQQAIPTALFHKQTNCISLNSLPGACFPQPYNLDCLNNNNNNNILYLYSAYCRPASKRLFSISCKVFGATFLKGNINSYLQFPHLLFQVVFFVL